jgi:molecular chaperone DnaJ
MAKEKDLYAILGLAKGAAADDIRKAYRKLARKYHPDLNPGDKQAEERFKDLSLANDVLSDTAKRTLYDEFGMEGLQAGFDPARAREYKRWADSGHGFSFRRGPGGAAPEGFDFGFETPRGRRRGGGRQSAEERNFADILNEMFGGSGGEEPSDRAGQDIEHPVEVDLLDALRGTRTAVTVRRPGPCGTCHGSGRVGRRPCTTCSGTGVVETSEKLSVKIPAGVGDGSRVRVAGKGGAGANGGKPGNLYFVIRVRPHPRIQRDGKDLTLDVPITVVEAIRGATITVPTLTGEVKLKVPPGSQSGQRMRLRGRGAPDPKGGEPGDLYVRLMVQVPTAASPEELQDALAALERAYRDDPRADLSL